jgi:hypothetical protein
LRWSRLVNPAAMICKESLVFPVDVVLGVLGRDEQSCR